MISGEARPQNPEISQGSSAMISGEARPQNPEISQGSSAMISKNLVAKADVLTKVFFFPICGDGWFGAEMWYQAYCWGAARKHG